MINFFIVHQSPRGTMNECMNVYVSELVSKANRKFKPCFMNSPKVLPYSSVCWAWLSVVTCETCEVLVRLRKYDYVFIY